MSPGARLVSALTLASVFSWALVPGAIPDMSAEAEVEGWIRTSRDLFSAEDWTAALVPTLALVDRFPTQQVYAERLANIYRRLDKPVEEASAWEQFVKSAATPQDACPALPRAYQRAGDHTRALLAFERCRDFDPSSAEGWFFLGQAYRLAGRRLDALQTFREAVRVDPLHADSRVGLAATLLAADDAAGSLKAIEPAGVSNPRYADVHLMQGLALMRLGRRTESRAALERALALRDTYPDVHLALGVLDFGDGEPAAAHARFVRADALSPGRADVHVWLRRTRELGQ
jgi:tetratricopeptide (TPR) repeat protein